MNVTISSAPKAVLFSILGANGILWNVLVILALQKCDRISYVTSLLMKLQCFLNLTALFPKTFYSPVVIVLKSQIHPYLNVAHGVPIMVGLYGAFATQTVMAVTRMIVFRAGSPSALDGLTRLRSCALCMGCLLYGAVFSLLGLLPCCWFGMDPISGRHFFKDELGVIAKFTIANDLLTFPTMFVCYLVALSSMRHFRSSVERETISLAEMRHELKVLGQFVLVSTAWGLLVGFYRSLQYKLIPVSPWMLNMTEINRYIFLTIDPVVYLIFLAEVRENARKFCSKQRTEVRPSQEAAGQRRKSALESRNDILIFEEDQF